MDDSQFSEPTRRWLASGRHLKIEGKRVFLYERGGGQSILMLHGFPTSAYDWRGVIDGLASAYRCVSLDFPRLWPLRQAGGVQLLALSADRCRRGPRA